MVSELARRGLAPRPSTTHDGGLPIFDVPADAAIIPGDRAGELLADEGLE